MKRLSFFLITLIALIFCPATRAGVKNVAVVETETDGVCPDGLSEVGSPHSSVEARESAWSEGGDKLASNLKRNTEGTKRPTAMEMSERRMRER